MNDGPQITLAERDESDARGYSAIVKAAAKLACSPIVSREAQREAEDFVRSEMDRWSEHSVTRALDEATDSDNVDDGPKD